MKKISLFGVFGLFCLLLAGLFSPRLATAFTYQGVLKENGIPVTGTRDMIFSLYSQSDCAVGFQDAQAITDVSVNNGLFNQSVLESSNSYTGKRLWLRVTVNNTHVSCQEITPVPLAMGLVPNAYIRGDSQAATLYAVNANDAWGVGLEGRYLPQTGGGIGLWGASNSPDGTGVLAYGGYGTYGAALEIQAGAIKVASAGIGSGTPVFIHQVNTAVGGNICQVQNYSTVIDNKIVNGVSGAILIVTPNFGPNNTGTAPAVGIPAVYYDATNQCGKGSGRWVIYNLNVQPQTNNSLFNVMAVVP